MPLPCRASICFSGLPCQLSSSAVLAQMFVIGGGEVNIGVGAFAGLVNVLSATLLPDEPALGVLSLLERLPPYSLLGAVIRACRNPCHCSHPGRLLHLAGHRSHLAARARR